MANTTPDKMRGLLVPTINITKDNIWPEQSTFTQQNSRAGVALPSQSYTGLSLAMAGSQSQDITVETVEGEPQGRRPASCFLVLMMSSVHRMPTMSSLIGSI